MASRNYVAEREERRRDRKWARAAATVGIGAGVIGIGARILPVSKGIKNAAASGAKTVDATGKSVQGLTDSIKQNILPEVKETVKKVGGTADAATARIQDPLNRKEKAISKEISSERKRIRRSNQKVRKSKRWDDRMKSGGNLPEWRRRLNKLPGGRVVLQSKLPMLSLEDRIASKQCAKIIALDWTEGVQSSSGLNPREIRDMHRKAKKFVAQGRKGKSLAHDIEETVRGKRTNPRRKRYWEKQAFKDAALAVGLTAATGGGVSAWRNRQAIGNKLGDIMHGFSEDWHTARPTSSSVRVYQKGYKRRDRRKKTWDERKGNRDKMWAATAALGAVAAPAAYVKGRRDTVSKDIVGAIAGNLQKQHPQIAHGHVQSALNTARAEKAAARKDWLKKLLKKGK
jgi:hypothetical protein